MKNICNQFNNNNKYKNYLHIGFYYNRKPLSILKKSNRNQIYVNINKNGIELFLRFNIILSFYLLFQLNRN